MDGEEPFLTVEDLLSYPPVVRAEFLELSICDMVHFRLIQPNSIFQLVEARLQERNADRYSGFAECRMAVERSMKGASTKDKVDACCTRRPEWLDDRLILYSTELEVWMDLSYPNPWGLKLYHSALMEGKYISIPILGPFTESFHELLKEKNGYELTETPEPGYSMLRVYVGKQSFLKESYMHLVTNYRESRPHPMASHDSLGAQLVYGVTQKDLEEHSVKETPLMSYFPHAFGYRLMGPTILYLLQWLLMQEEAVGIVGKGSSLLKAVIEENNDYWPWLPNILEDDPVRYASIFEEESDTIPLIADAGQDGLIDFSQDPYAELVAPAVFLLARSSFEGSDSELIQKGIRSFIRDYAAVTRGLFIPIPKEPLLEHWIHCTLLPMNDFLSWAGANGHVPGFKGKCSPGKLVDELKHGNWPTGHLMASGGISRWWAGMFASKRKKQVFEAAESDRLVD
ncbi:MAG: hypothetical protein AB3N63_08985 [Puniceicoccaceae bacterium]